MSTASSLLSVLFGNFLGKSPRWYKLTIISFLLINPFLLLLLGPALMGWIVLFEFIFTLALALKCYPLQPGGLLAIEAIALGLASPDAVYTEVSANLQVLLLLMFMVAGIFFMKDLLLLIFTRLLTGVRSKVLLSLLFSLSAAFLSAFLDALTVTAVLIAVATGFYGVYHKAVSAAGSHKQYDPSADHLVHENHANDLLEFRAFMRSLLMHGVVGTALGGVTTLVGEPQNLLIAKRLGWEFIDFFVMMAPITMPVLVAGISTCILLEKVKWFGYGTTLPDTVRHILEDYAETSANKRSSKYKAALWVQGIVGLLLILALAFHVAEVGLVGLAVIILLTSLNGIIEEHQIGHAFKEALPFTALLVVFFAIVTIIHEQHLFNPVIDFVLNLERQLQPSVFFVANGLLSAISDNVFVATIYINEVKAAFDAGDISRSHFEALAIAINTGTNIPSVATPNGQAAFLFLLTSALAPLIRLSYGTMVWMALPYTITMSCVGYLAVLYTL